MASVPFVGNLDSDDDVDQLDNKSDREEETEKVRHILALSCRNEVEEKGHFACGVKRPMKSKERQTSQK